MVNCEILSLKWRPKSFKDFVGHDYIIDIIINSLNKRKIYNSYLFYGPKGVGKTSLSRLMSSSLNCKKGITSIPCQKCSNCININLGKSSDVIEIDAASRTKIEDIKDLLSGIYYLPISSLYKIYIIDEVHMLSRYSFNFLLKILEEPPSHAKFILATTEISKIPDTILSRCMSFNLKALGFYDILNRLKFVAQEENILFELDALKLIAINSDGSIRNSLVILDQVLMLYKDSYITFKKVNLVLGKVNIDMVVLFLESVFIGNKKNIFRWLNIFFKKNIDYNNLLLSMLEIIHNLFLLHMFPNLCNEEMLGVTFLCFNDLLRLSKLVSSKDISVYYQIFIFSKRNLYFSSNFKIGFEFGIFCIISYQDKLLNLNILNEDLLL